MSAEKQFVYVGNWSSGSSWSAKAPTGCGLSVFAYEPETAGLTFVESCFGEVSVGAACVDRRRNVLYCVHEVMTLPGNPLGGGGLVFAFGIDPRSGRLHEIGHRQSYGSLPSYATLDSTGTRLLVSNHSGRTPVTKTAKDENGVYRIALEWDESSTVLFPLGDDGSIGEPLDVYRHESTGPLPRQTHSQIHSVTASPSGRLFVSCDKGGDEIVCFRIARGGDRLEVCEGGRHRAAPGSSPRYGAFHPTRPYFYANHETSPFVSAFAYDEAGALTLLQYVGALADGSPGGAGARQSDIRIHPSGKWLYSLIRELDALAVFEIDADSGRLRLTSNVPLDGVGPRGCAISPDGRFMLIAALESAEVLIWSIAHDGTPAPTGRRIAQPSPGNVTFF